MSSQQNSSFEPLDPSSTPKISQTNQNVDLTSIEHVSSSRNSEHPPLISPPPNAGSPATFHHPSTDLLVSTEDTSINIPSSKSTLGTDEQTSNEKYASAPSESVSHDSSIEFPETPSKKWTVKGIFSSLRDKVQEPTDSSAAVGKFYYDSVNMFQGFQDFSSSDSDDNLDASPRSGESYDSPNPNISGIKLKQNITTDLKSQTSSSQDKKSTNRRARGSSSSSLSSSHKSQFNSLASSSSIENPNFDKFDIEDRQERPTNSISRNTGSELSEAAFEVNQTDRVPFKRRNSASGRYSGSKVPLDWKSELMPLELEDEKSRLHEENYRLEEEEIDRARRRESKRASKSKWYHKLWRQIKRQQTWVFLLVLGLSAAVLGLAMEETMHLLIIGRNKLANLTSNYFINYMLWVGFAMSSCTLAAFLVHYVAPYSAGSGIPAVKSILSGVMLEHYLSFRTMSIKVLGLICVYAAGMFVGKEGPYVHISTALASQLARLPFFERIRRNEGMKLQLFAAGCAAGVAVTFGAPIGGVIFSIEVTTTYYLIQNLSKGFFCAIVATLFVHLLDTQGLIAFFSTDFAPAPYTSYELVAFSLIGISFGLLGVLFNLFVKKIAQLRRNYKILNTSRYGQVLVVAAISALATFPILPLRTGPTSVINDLFSTQPLKNWTSPNIYFVLAVVVVLEFVMCGVSVGLPIPCGLYTPLFILGAALGRLIGESLQAIHVLPNIVPAGYAVVGAAAFAAATTRTLSSSIICFELTRQLEHLLPVLLAVLIASAVGNFFGPSIYDELLKMKGLPYMPPFKSHGTKTARSIMRTDVVYLTTDFTYQDIQNLLFKHHYSSFPLVQSEVSKTLLGVIPRSTLERLLESLESKLQEIAHKQVDYLNLYLQEDPNILNNNNNNNNGAITNKNNTLSNSSIMDNPVENLDTLDSDRSANSSPIVNNDDFPAASSSASILSKPIEHGFKSHFGGLAPSLILDSDGHLKPESQQLQAVIKEITTQAMNEKVGLSRSTPGLDAGPFQLPVQTSGSKVHFLFAMLGLNCGYILDQGELVGVITKRDLINLQ